MLFTFLADPVSQIAVSFRLGVEMRAGGVNGRDEGAFSAEVPVGVAIGLLFRKALFAGGALQTLPINAAARRRRVDS